MLTRRISSRFIEDLLTRVDIYEVINPRVALRKAGRNFTACCPFHHEKTPSFTVNRDKQFYHCFGCGAHGNAVVFLMNYQRLSFTEAVEELALRCGLTVIYEENTVASNANADYKALYEILQKVAEYYQQQLRTPEVVTYLRDKRGLTGQIAKAFGLGYASNEWDNLLRHLGTTQEQQALLFEAGLIKEGKNGHYYDRFRHRVMFPIHDSRGKIIAFGGRLLENKEDEPKYLNSPETPLFQKGRELYAWHRVKQLRELKRVVVVEGYMDVIGLAQQGICNVVATLGTAVTKDHLTLLFRSVSEIIFCFDGDTAGSKAAKRALETVLPLLRDGLQASFVFLPQGEDPDSLVRKEGADNFNQRLSQALPFSQFLFDSLKPLFDLNTLEGKTQFAKRAKDLLVLLPPNGVYFDSLTQELQRLVTSVNLEKLTTLIKQNNKQTNENESQHYDLVRKTIRLLLYKPDLVQWVEYPEKIAHLRSEASALLAELIAFLRQESARHIGVIQEHFRNTDRETLVLSLSPREPLLKEDTEIEMEFRGALERLYEKCNKQRRYDLATKGLDNLTVAEKQEYRELSSVGVSIGRLT